MDPKKFPYRVLTEWSDADACYVARVPAFALLAAHGDTMAEGMAEAQRAAEGMLDVLGAKAPAPDNAAPSGSIRLRLPPYLYGRLSRRASVEGVSLNQLMVTLLAERWDLVVEQTEKAAKGFMDTTKLEKKGAPRARATKSAKPWKKRASARSG